MSQYIGSTVSAKRQTALLAWETNPNFTRGERTLSNIAETDYPVGTLIANDGTNDVVLAPAAVDGTEDFVGIILDGRTIPANGSAAVLTLERGPAIIKESGIEWGAATDPQKAAIRAAMASLNIQIVNAVGQHV